jgi:hypothetical protein
VVCLVLLCGCGRLGFEPLGAPDTPVGGACAIDGDCTAHAACAQQACVCAAGFAVDGDGACAWIGGIVANPALSDPMAWTANGATIDGSLMQAGMLDPGAAQFQATAICNLARVTQTVVMPRETLAGPLVFDVQYRYSDTMPLEFGAPAIGLGDVWRDDLIASELGWREVRACLGSGQYAPGSSTGAGASVLLTVMPASTGLCGLGASELDVDHLDIVPANPGECAAPGTAENGDAESTGGWTFSAGASSVAAIVDGAGDNGTRGVRLFLGNRCDDPVATDTTSIGTALAHPAFELYDRTGSGVVATATLGGREVPLAAGTGVGRVTRACLPVAMRGGAYTFSADIDGGSGTCGNPLSYESILDELRIVDDARCAGNGVVDSGFEAQLPLLGAYSVAGKGIAQVVTGAGIPHAGAAALRLDASVTCYGGTWNTDVVGPPSTPTAGPALAFFYRADAANKTKFEVIASGSVFTGTADNTWRQGVVCLDPKLAGRPQTVSFTREFLGGTCEIAMATETAFVDDLALTTDPSCPSS